MFISNSAFHRKFWIEQPALLVGLTLLFGFSGALFWEAPWKWIFPGLWTIYLSSLRSWAMVPLLIGSAVYSLLLYPATPNGDIGYFSIASLKPHQTPFQKNLLYQGMLYIEGQKVPCSLYHPPQNHPNASCDYIVKGSLQKKGAYDFFFKVKEWIPVKKSWSLAEFRYQTKEKLRLFLEKNLKKRRVATFLSSLITGDVEDRSLRYEFSRLGLQHILAISGFHFGILITFCTFFLGLFLPFRWKTITLLLAINAYFLFVGSVPAVQRSWLTAAFYLIGKLIGRSSTPLNLLGVACTIEVIIDPLVCSHLGFQLSFLSCASILLLHPPIDQFLQRHFPKRSPNDYLLLPHFSKLISLFASFFRQAISITLAVNTALFPLLLFHFHQFPLLGLLYNLFFPFLVACSLFLLLTSLLTHLIFPPLAYPFFKVTDLFTAELLDLSAYPPVALDYSFKISLFPSWIIPFYLFGLFSLCFTKFLFPLTNRGSLR